MKLCNIEIIWVRPIFLKYSYEQIFLITALVCCIPPCDTRNSIVDLCHPLVGSIDIFPTSQNVAALLHSYRKAQLLRSQLAKMLLNRIIMNGILGPHTRFRLLLKKHFMQSPFFVRGAAQYCCVLWRGLIRATMTDYGGERSAMRHVETNSLKKNT
jgi:hypothetical protein